MSRRNFARIFREEFQETPAGGGRRFAATDLPEALSRDAGEPAGVINAEQMESWFLSYTIMIEDRLQFTPKASYAVGAVGVWPV